MTFKLEFLSAQRPAGRRKRHDDVAMTPQRLEFLSSAATNVSTNSGVL